MLKDYVKRVNGVMTTVYCKVCGTPIMDTVVVEERQEKRGDKEFIVQKTRITPLPTYAEVTLVFAGHKHITSLCKTCSQKPDLDVKEIYKIDMKELLKGN